MIYWELFIGFLEVGLFAFGGAYAAIPLIRDVVLSYGWMTDEMVSYIIAVSESTPGPIMVNMATYVGSSQAGFFGALLATTAVVLPAFFIVILLLAVLKNLQGNRWAGAALDGVKPCIIGIILSVGVSMLIENCFSWGDGNGFAADFKSIAVAAGLAVIFYGSRAIRKKKMSPILLIVIAAVIGILVF